MSTHASATFEITGWDQKPYGEPDEQDAEKTDEAAKLSRARVTKIFRGDVEGTSEAELLMCQGAGESGGYIAQERVKGHIGGRGGSFVIQHGGIKTANMQRSFGNIVPGSGTGELSGLRGEVKFAHDEQGATLTLDYEFE